MSLVYPYTRANLLASINARIHGKMGLITNKYNLANDVVNEVFSLFLRSAKKKAVLAPNLFNEIYQYGAPSDLEGNKIIGIQPQSMDRSRNNIWNLVTEEEFDIKKQTEYNLIALTDHTFVRGLLVSAKLDNIRELTIASIQGTSEGNGSWSAYGNASNLTTDTYNFIKGSGSLQFDLTSGGTTAGIEDTAVPTFDLTQYKSNASVFTWMYVNATLPTNVKLRVGSDSSNYYEMTATTASDATAFVTGWNLVRFDFNSKTTTGTPVDTSGAYVALFVTKGNTDTDTSYRFNWLNAKLGSISNVIYYSTNPWYNPSTGAWSATAPTDASGDNYQIVCDNDEYSLFVEKGVEIFGYAAREYQDAQIAAMRYGDPAKHTGMSADYKRNYPTEALGLTSSYYDMGNPGINNNPIR